MGSSFSTSYNSDHLYNEIKKNIKELIYDYQIWTNDKICDNLEVIYYDKLIKLNKPNLLDISSAIGYKSNKEYDKQKLCQIIISHYKRRIKLLQIINQALDKEKIRLYQAKNGPVCKNTNKYVSVEDFFICEQIPNSLWIDRVQYQKIIEKYKKVNIQTEWIFWIKKLEKCYYKSLRILLKIVRKIKQDIDNKMDEIEFDKLENSTIKIIENMNKLCELYYLLAVNYN
ncbi:Hypothetical protein KVN_LOCUS495 [uncultured virus]|nr:Hypothetical protein KVN_LOCUS495 [uncultured virus]